MIKLIKNVIKITNDNIILAIPLVIFMWIIGAYLSYSKFTADSLPEFILAIITLLFMLGAFLSGWFYMVKKAVLLSKKVFVLDEDRTKATLNLFKEIPTGIGNYFLSFIGMAIIILFLFSTIAKLGMSAIGDLGFTSIQFKQIMGSPEDIKMLVNSLTETQLIKLFNLNLLFMACSAIISYLTLLWVPETINGCKNTLVSLFTSIKKVLKKPFKTFKIFLFIGVSNFLMSFISTFAIYNPITYLLMMIIYFYFLVFIVVLLFSYYETEYCENIENVNDSEQLQNIKDNEIDSENNNDTEEEK